MKFTSEHDLSRRNFLRYSAAGAAALLAPSLLKGHEQLNAVNAEALEAKTTAGQIRGKFNDGVYSFQGVPYGMDTAKTRFAAPKPAEPWQGVRDCLTWGPRTIQPAPAAAAANRAAGTQAARAGAQTARANAQTARSGTQATAARDRGFFMPPDLGRESEDCLNLNVWTRGMRDGGKRPVMVYFHGGGYTYGTANSVLYDGARLTQRGDVVVVTVNGRLNAFGFLYLAELGGESFADSGMAGQLDLVLALRWIRENIAEFGGDPDRVLIFGQSGGGGKCAALMAMPPAKGLFHRVVCMSGQLIAGAPADRATERARAVLKALDLEPGKIDAIRTMPMDRIREAARASQTYGPVADGRSLPTGPFWPQAAEQSLDVPLMFGNTHDETRFLGGVAGVDLFALAWDGVVPALKATRPPMNGFDPEDLVAKYKQWYPDYSPRDVYFQITTDIRVWRAEQVAAGKRAENPRSAVKTWVYQMDWVSPAGNGRYKSPHTMDLPFAFDNCALAPGMVGASVEQQKRAQVLADAVAESYIAFARTGNPNNKAVPNWPHFDLQNRATMIFDDKVRVENDPRKPQREVIQAVPYVPNQG